MLFLGIKSMKFFIQKASLIEMVEKKSEKNRRYGSDKYWSCGSRQQKHLPNLAVATTASGRYESRLGSVAYTKLDGIWCPVRDSAGHGIYVLRNR